MVDLPEGKMKSREGTVVDADDLMDEMERAAASSSSKATNNRTSLQKKKETPLPTDRHGGIEIFHPAGGP